MCADDVNFTFDFSDEKVPAHKSVLAAGSVVFKKMFDDAWNTGDQVHLHGKQPEIFKQCLRFFYHCENYCDFNLQTIMHVMEYLHEYQMDESLKFCARFWIRNCQIDDICLAYAWAIHFRMDDFQRLCEQKISIDCMEIFKTDTFFESPFHVIDRIISLNTLICDEKHALNAILQWAKFHCEQNGKESVYNQLTSGAINLLHKIRYKSMIVGDFVPQMNLSGGFFETCDEYEDVLRLLTGTGTLKTGKFTTQPRKIHIWPLTLQEINLSQMEQESLWGMPEFIMHVNVNKDILWYEFEMINIQLDLVHEYEFTYQMIVKEVSSSINVNTETIDGINPNVKFKRPVLLKSNTTYAIHFNFTTQRWNYYDEVPMRNGNFQCDDVIINAVTKLNGCLIKKIKFTTVDYFLSH